MPAPRKDFELTVQAPEKWDVDQIDPIVWRSLAQIYVNKKRREARQREQAEQEAKKAASNG